MVRFSSFVCLLFCIALVIAPATMTKCITIDKSFVGIWMLDEGKGEQINDLTENHNDGTVNGNAKWVNGKFGSAIEFDGATSVIVPNAEILMPKEQITVTAWINFNDSGKGQDMVIARIEPGYSLQKYSDDKIEGWVNIGGWKGVRELAGGEILKPNQWHHVAFVYDGTSLRTYVDGELDRENKISGALDIAKAPFTIGSWKGEGYFWRGIIDEVSISNVARTKEEIKNIMLGFKALAPVNAADDKLTTTWAYLKKLDNPSQGNQQFSK